MSEAEELRESLDAWKAHPVTQKVMQVLSIKAEEAKQTWIRASWDGGSCDERLRADLKATAETYKYVTDLDAEEIEDVLNDQSERD